MQEKMEIVATAPSWVVTALTTIGAGLVTVLLVWIATSQIEIGKNQAVILNNQEIQGDQLETAVESQRAAIVRLDTSLNTIWPRIRNHGEAIEILKRELELVTGKDIELPDPERF